MKTLLAAIFATTLATSFAVAGPPPPTLGYSSDPSAILRNVSSLGATSVVAELYDHPADWDNVLSKIRSGNAAWLNVAVALQPGTDAGTSSMLTEAVGLALILAPANVLSIASPAFSLNDICGGRQDPLPTYAQARAELEAQIASVTSVKDESMAAMLAECLRLLKRHHEELKRFFEVK